MDLESEEYRPVVRIAERLIADAKAKRLAAFGPAIPRGWSKAVQESYPDVWKYWPSVPGGWIDLCMALSEHLRMSVPGAQIEDSKEKYGALKTSVTGDESMPPDAFDLSDLYEELSTHVCQDCGDPGHLRTDGMWDATLCDKHAETRDMQ